MIAVLQRVSSGSVTVDGTDVGTIGVGLVVFLGVMAEDEEADSEFLAQKIAGFRIFNDDQKKMNRSILEIKGEALVVSQFTLCANWRKGRRPSFVHAAPPEKGERLYLNFVRQLQARGLSVATGAFGAMMEVKLVNDGPVTFVLDSQQK